MKKYLEVVGAMFEDEEGRILSLLRPSHKKLGNYWEFPGGKVEEGESKEEAIIREMKEELNCDVEVLGFAGENTMDYGEMIVHISVLRCRMKSAWTMKEHSAYVWLPKENLMSLVWLPADLPILEQIQKER